MTLSFKVDPKFKKALEEQAKKDNRSLANYVITVLMRHLESKGINWREEQDE